MENIEKKLDNINKNLSSINMNLEFIARGNNSELNELKNNKVKITGFPEYQGEYSNTIEGASTLSTKIVNWPEKKEKTTIVDFIPSSDTNKSIIKLGTLSFLGIINGLYGIEINSLLGTKITDLGNHIHYILLTLIIIELLIFSSYFIKDLKIFKLDKYKMKENIKQLIKLIDENITSKNNELDTKNETINEKEKNIIYNEIKKLEEKKERHTNKSNNEFETEELSNRLFIFWKGFFPYLTGIIALLFLWLKINNYSNNHVTYGFFISTLIIILWLSFIYIYRRNGDNIGG